jgi:hypothetical protein
MALVIGIILFLLISIVFYAIPKFNSIFNPLPPIIKHGEFPFHLKYELNGKVYEINDTVVCDFDMIGENGGSIGKERMWKEHLKSGKDRITLISDNDVPSVIHPKRINSKIEVYYNYGSATFFMDDPSGSTSEKPQVEYIETYNKSSRVTVIDATPLSAKQLQKYFGIKIISYDYSPPIKNTYKQ